MISAYPAQEPCECASCADFQPCAAASWQSTGPCLGSIVPLEDGRLGWRYAGDCTHYGTEVDGGLCEGCYVATK